jgi:polysaccharide pyruvyl transferase WcaK-like protein
LLTRTGLLAKASTLAGVSSRDQYRLLERDPIPHDVEDLDKYYWEIVNSDYFSAERELLQWCDVVVINGEGNIVNPRPGETSYRRSARYLLALGLAAKKIYKKPVHICNHTVDPRHPQAERLIKELYPLADSVAIREKISLGTLKDLGIDTGTRIVPDALYALNTHPKYGKGESRIKKRVPYICLGDSSGLPYVPWQIEETYRVMIRKLKKEFSLPVLLVDGGSTVSHKLVAAARAEKVKLVHPMATSWVELKNHFTNSLVYISGRWHPSIMALMEDVPCALWGSDSHKTKALSDELGDSQSYLPLAELDENIESIVRQTAMLIDEGEYRREHIREKVETAIIEVESYYASIFRTY